MKSFVAIDNENPLPPRQIQSVVARRRKIIHPGEIVHPRTVTPGRFLGAVPRARVHHHDLINGALERLQTAADRPFFVTRDQARGDRRGRLPVRSRRTPTPEHLAAAKQRPTTNVLFGDRAGLPSSGSEPSRGEQKPRGRQSLLILIGNRAGEV